MKDNAQHEELIERAEKLEDAAIRCAEYRLGLEDGAGPYMVARAELRLKVAALLRQRARKFLA